MKKYLTSLALVLMSFSSYSMRCGNNLITEGTSYTDLVYYCGAPTYDNGGIVIYHNKDYDGLNYYLHISNDGSIDNIDFRRN